MNVLVYGSGAREHAIVCKVLDSKLLSKLFLFKPNDGFAHLGEVLDAKNNKDLAKIAKEKKVDLMIVGPEQPLVDGVVDEFKKQSIPVIGTDKYWSNLEGSKIFAKNFMQKNNIPTAKYTIIENENQIQKALEDFKPPYVIKADGLAAGKGVCIVNEANEALAIIQEYLKGKFGKASQKVILEEFLEGEEFSLMSIWDGKTLLPFIPARDYKRLLNDNKGSNTGGMGSYCPVELITMQKTELAKYIKNLENALRKEQADFVGVIYSGLILTSNQFKVLEYNVRFGDPEIQSLLLNLENDLLEVFRAAINKNLDKVTLHWKKEESGCVVVAARGYPENPLKGCEIKNIKEIEKKYSVQVFYAGVKKEQGILKSNGGRVLSVCKTAKKPFDDIYHAIDELDFDDKIFRSDIANH